MSSGSFILAKYETDDGDINPIRIQPETIADDWNVEPAGASTGSLIRVSGGRRRIGLKARAVRLTQNVGTPVLGYQPTRSITLPVLTPAAWLALSPGNSVAYGGGTWTVSGKSTQAGR